MSGESFVREARTRVDRLSEGFLALEENDQDVDELFRDAHSLKSSFSMEGYEEAADLAHAMEDVLSELRRGTMAADTEVVDLLLQGTDTASAMVSEIDQHGEVRRDPTDTVEELRIYADSAEGKQGGADSAGDEFAESPDVTTDADNDGVSESPVGAGANAGEVTESARRSREDASADETAFDAELDEEVKSALAAASQYDDLDALIEEMGGPDEELDVEGGGSLADLELDESGAPADDGAVVEQELDADIERALDAASEYEDLDALVEEMGGPEEVDLEGGGSFETLDFVETSESVEDGASSAATESSIEEDIEAEADTEAGSPEVDAESQEALDADVENALDKASEFDDLDALAEEMDGPEEDTEIEGAGSFDDLLSDTETETREASGAPAQEGEAAAPEEPATTSGAEADTGATGTAAPDQPDAVSDEGPAAESEAEGPAGHTEFQWVKDETSTEDTSLSELQEEIEEESFGQFDDEDEVSIQELLEIEPEEEEDMEAEAAETTAESPAATADSTTAQPETGVEAETPAEADATAEPESPTEVESPAGAESPAEADSPAQAESEPAEMEGMEGRSEVSEKPDVEAEEPEMEPAATAEADTPAGQSDFEWIKDETETEETSLPELQEEIESESFGQFDEEDEVSIQELIEVGEGEEAGAAGGVATEEELEVEAEEEKPGEETEEEIEEKEPEEEVEEEEPEEEEDVEEEKPEEEVEEEEPEEEDVEEEEPEEEEPPEPMASEWQQEPGGVAETPESPPSPLDEMVEGSADAADGASASGEEIDLEADTEADDEVARALEKASSRVESADTEEDVEGFDVETETGQFEDRFESLFAEDDRADATTVPSLERSSLPTEEYRPSELEAESRLDEIKSITIDVSYADDLLSMVEELSMESRRLQDIAEDGRVRERAEAMAGTLRDLRTAVTDIRLLPVETVTRRLGRVVRDVSKQTEKDVELEVTGSSTRVDRSIIDRLGDPLVHLVRNAVDHGIESPSEREAAGKPETGQVEVDIHREGEVVVVEVSDDGRGLDPASLRDEAVSAGIIAEDEAASLSDEQAYELVFHPGFSTADEVTETSGRGVGMDVVKNEVTAANGQLEIESEHGTGTTVRMRMPVTMAITDILLVEAGGEEFAFPAGSVLRLDRQGGEQLTTGLSGVEPDREVDLAATLGTGSVDDTSALIVTETADEILGVECDRVIDRRSSVVSPYDDLLADLSLVSGATRGSEEQLVNVINIEEL